MSETGQTDFALARLMARQQFTLWHDLLRPMFRVALPDAASLDGFAAEAEIVPVADGLLTVCASTAQSFERTMRDVRTSGWDHIVVQNYTRGGFTGVSADDGVTVAAGDINVIDLSRTLHTQATDFANLTLVLPRDRLALAARGNLNGRVIRGGSALAPVIALHMQALAAHGGGLSAIEADHALDALCLMLAGSSLREAETGVRAAAGASLRDRACAFIDRHLGDASLTPARIAAGCRMSRSTLYRLFDLDGGVMAHVADRRLDRAFSVLGRATADGLGIAQIAYASGFSSESHFSRSFRRRFGIRPSEVRGGAGIATGVLQEPSSLKPAAWVAHMRRLRDAID